MSFAEEPTKTNDEKRQEESRQIRDAALEIVKLYDLPENCDFLDITDAVLAGKETKPKNRKKIQETGRRIFLFTYPSDGLRIKAFVSFVPEPQDKPMIVFLRGGNREFGILNPGGMYALPGGYTILATAYRGGVSEGVDEFGGEDVNDVKNLIDYIPELEAKLNHVLCNKTMFLVGGSRGGMEMFLALARFPEIQKMFQKVVSLSGLTNMRACIEERPDMKEMFVDDFGLIDGPEGDSWLDHRDPILTVEKIDKDLPILIAHGSKDVRVSYRESYSIFEKLQENGNNVTYLEEPEGEHCLWGLPDPMQPILNWLEQ